MLVSSSIPLDLIFEMGSLWTWPAILLPVSAYPALGYKYCCLTQLFVWALGTGLGPGPYLLGTGLGSGPYLLGTSLTVPLFY